MKKVVLASLVFLSLSAETFRDPRLPDMGRPLGLDDIESGISKSARFELREGFGFGLNVNFKELSLFQDNFQVAYLSNSSKNPIGDVYRFQTKYAPGVEVGFVFNMPYDHWNLNGEYFWYSVYQHFLKPNVNSNLYYSPIFSLSPYDNLLNRLDARRDIYLNVADLYLSRPFYSGRNVTIEPKLGLKSVIIKQKFSIDSDVQGSLISQSAITKSRSWAIGPKLGFLGNFLLGGGVSIFSDISTSILYSTFCSSKLKYSSTNRPISKASNRGYNLLEPVLDSSIGLTFGGYVMNNSFYVNMKAAYNFSAYFAENVSRALVATATSRQAAPGNLYTQGASIGFNFAF
jgi:hypothetical protein